MNLRNLNKARLRNDLLDQMNDNANKRLAERSLKNWQDEYDNERIYWDTWDDRARHDHEEFKRK